MRLTCCLLGQDPTPGKTGTKVRIEQDRDKRGKGKRLSFMKVFILHIETCTTLSEFEGKDRDKPDLTTDKNQRQEVPESKQSYLFFYF